MPTFPWVCHGVKSPIFTTPSSAHSPPLSLSLSQKAFLPLTSLSISLEGLLRRTELWDCHHLFLFPTVPLTFSHQGLQQYRHGNDCKGTHAHSRAHTVITGDSNLSCTVETNCQLLHTHTHPTCQAQTRIQIEFTGLADNNDTMLFMFPIRHKINNSCPV